MQRALHVEKAKTAETPPGSGADLFVPHSQDGMADGDAWNPPLTPHQVEVGEPKAFRTGEGKSECRVHAIAPHAVRERFQRLRSVDDCVTFFGEHGPFMGQATTAREISPVSDFAFLGLAEFQRYFREAMLWSIDQEPQHWKNETLEESFPRAFSLDLMRPVPMLAVLAERREPHLGTAPDCPFSR
jgi:hypothetical protein